MSVKSFKDIKCPSIEHLNLAFIIISLCDFAVIASVVFVDKLETLDSSSPQSGDFQRARYVVVKGSSSKFKPSNSGVDSGLSSGVSSGVSSCFSQASPRDVLRALVELVAERVLAQPAAQPVAQPVAERVL